MGKSSAEVLIGESGVWCVLEVSGGFVRACGG